MLDCTSAFPSCLTNLQPSATGSRAIPAQSVIVQKDQSHDRPLLLYSGWACAQRIDRLGRRLFLDLYLPGDIIGLNALPSAEDEVVALTDVKVKTILSPGERESQELLQRVIHRLMRHCVRATRFSCEERLVDFLLEVHHRLLCTGNADSDGFDFPTSHALLSEMLGMSPVHLSRTIARCNRGGRVTFAYRRVTIHGSASAAEHEASEHEASEHEAGSASAQAA